MVKDEAARQRWKECAPPKDTVAKTDSTSTAEVDKVGGTSTNSQAPKATTSATAATSSTKGQNHERRRTTQTPTTGTAISLASSTVAVGAVPGGGTAACSSSSGGKKGAFSNSTTANTWLEAPMGHWSGNAASHGTASSTAVAGRPLAVSSVSAASIANAVGVQQQAQEPPHSGEVFLMEMLAAMDSHMQQLRETQQNLVATVELACRRALGRSFVKLVLVGSVALRVETPGSDVDVVCFTRRDEASQQIGPDGQIYYDAVGLPVDVLRRVHWALNALVSQYPDQGASFSMELIDDARVPILRVLWGSSIAVDVSVDQSRPVDHVRWFQRVGAAPKPTSPPPAVAPLVTLTLRCVKWWLRQRQVPRTKEGGLPTLAWLLMAVHVCSLPETHEQAITTSGQRPMVALLASLAAFFHHYAARDGLDGTLEFASDGSSSEFRRNKKSSSSSSSSRFESSPWASLSVLDPTREGAERLDLAPRVPPATQLLLSHELRRASQRLNRVPRGREGCIGDGRKVLEEVFEPLPEGINLLPSFGVNAMNVLGALFLFDQDAKGGTLVELGIIEQISPRPGWNAPFLHRFDDRSELVVRLQEVEANGRCKKKSNIEVSLCPCQFICRVHLEKDGKAWRLDSESLDRYQAMKRYLQEFSSRSKDPESEKTKVTDESSKEVVAEIAKLPSPSRARDSTQSSP